MLGKTDECFDCIAINSEFSQSTLVVLY